MCNTVETCADILARHDETAFDYALLAEAFSKLGDRGAEGLVSLARDPETASKAFALVAEPAIRDSTRERVFDLFPAPDPELHIALGRRHDSDVLRRRAIANLTSPARDAAIRVLDTQTQPFHEPDARAALPMLARANDVSPSLAVTRMIAATPAGAPELVKALRANDADVVVESYLALERLNPERARADLEAAFRASPASHAAIWALALERIGQGSRTFDAIGFGYEKYQDESLSPLHQAVMLHTALLYPAEGERSIGSEADGLVPALLDLPIGQRLSETAPTHPLFRDTQHLKALRGVWQDSASRIRFARALGKTGHPAAEDVLRDMFEKASDYRVQIAVIEALSELGAWDRPWLRAAVSRHPVAAVRQALGGRVGQADRICYERGGTWTRTLERMPYFESGRLEDGRQPGRWELVDAQPFQGGWLAAYREGVVRYASDDRSEFLSVKGRPIAVLADPVPAGQFRADGVWIVTRGENVAWLYRFTSETGLGSPSALPVTVEVRRQTLPGLDAREWMLAFDTPQETLSVRPDGRIVKLCSLIPPEPPR